MINETTELLGELSSSYFEMIRDAVYSDVEHDQPRSIILAVLQSVSSKETRSWARRTTDVVHFSQTLDITIQALAPITPYLAEEIYAHRTDIEKVSPSVFGRTWQSPVNPRPPICSCRFRADLAIYFCSTPAGTMPRLGTRWNSFFPSSRACRPFSLRVGRRGSSSSRHTPYSAFASRMLIPTLPAPTFQESLGSADCPSRDLHRRLASRGDHREAQ